MDVNNEPNLHARLCHRSQVPLELIREAQGGEVHLDMEDHRHEDYVKPKVKPKSFSGVGHVLGRSVREVHQVPGS